MKKGKKILIAAVSIAVLIAAVIIVVNIYKKSPIYIIKSTVMEYEKDFTIPVFSKKIKFEYERNTGEYAGKFQISEASAKRVKNKLDDAYERYLDVEVFVMHEDKIDKSGGTDLKMLNTTDVHNILYNREDWNSVADKEWLIEDGKIIFWYRTSTRYFRSESGELIHDDCYIKNDVVLYRNKDDKYILCIQRHDYTDEYVY